MSAMDIDVTDDKTKCLTFLLEKMSLSAVRYVDVSSMHVDSFNDAIMYGLASVMTKTVVIHDRPNLLAYVVHIHSPVMGQPDTIDPITKIPVPLTAKCCRINNIHYSADVTSTIDIYQIERNDASHETSNVQQLFTRFMELSSVSSSLSLSTTNNNNNNNIVPKFQLLHSRKLPCTRLPVMIRSLFDMTFNNGDTHEISGTFLLNATTKIIPPTRNIARNTIFVFKGKAANMLCEVEIRSAAYHQRYAHTKTLKLGFIRDAKRSNITVRVMLPFKRGSFVGLPDVLVYLGIPQEHLYPMCCRLMQDHMENVKLKSLARSILCMNPCNSIDVAYQRIYDAIGGTSVEPAAIREQIDYAHGSRDSSSHRKHSEM